MSLGLVLVSIGLAILIEGMVWALAPGMIDRLMIALQALTQADRRRAGLIAMSLGVVVIWLGLSLSPF